MIILAILFALNLVSSIINFILGNYVISMVNLAIALVSLTLKE